MPDALLLPERQHQSTKVWEDFNTNWSIIPCCFTDAQNCHWCLVNINVAISIKCIRTRQLGYKPDACRPQQVGDCHWWVVQQRLLWISQAIRQPDHSISTNQYPWNWYSMQNTQHTNMLNYILHPTDLVVPQTNTVQWPRVQKLIIISYQIQLFVWQFSRIFWVRQLRPEFEADIFMDRMLCMTTNKYQSGDHQHQRTHREGRTGKIIFDMSSWAIVDSSL